MRAHCTPTDRAQIIKEYLRGDTISDIAARYHISLSYPTVLARRAGYRVRTPEHTPQVVQNRGWIIDADALLKQIPPDTRDLTARLMGDPLPARSALALLGHPKL